MEDIRLIVGLGNPGSQYEHTRHNIGFMVVDTLLDQFGSSYSDWRSGFSGRYSDIIIGGEKVYLLKPETFMNLSGDSVAQLVKFYKLQPSEILVVHDEIDVPFGKLRLKKGGGAAGHNGIKSIASRLGTKDFFRVRVGVGRPKLENGPGPSVSSWVLGKFSDKENKELNEFRLRSIKAIESLCCDGLKTTQNRYH